MIRLLFPFLFLMLNLLKCVELCEAVDKCNPVILDSKWITSIFRPLFKQSIPYLFFSNWLPLTLTTSHLVPANFRCFFFIVVIWPFILWTHLEISQEVTSSLIFTNKVRNILKKDASCRSEAAKQLELESLFARHIKPNIFYFLKDLIVQYI